MSVKTTLVLPGKKVSVPRFFKRLIQIASAVALTAFIVLAVIVGNGLFIAKGKTFKGFDTWLAFIYRTDILATMVLTAVVTVLFVYWQRDQERR